MSTQSAARRSPHFNRTLNRAAAGVLESLETRRLMCAIDLDSTGGTAAAASSASHAKLKHDAKHIGDYPVQNDASAVASTLSDASATGTPLAAGVPLTSVPALSSRPGAYVKLYLDFDGAAAQKWGAYNTTATPAYDQDGDATTFSTGELNSINEIWQRVSEKYSPFNVDVTTVNPGDLNNGHVVQVVVGGDGAWLGSAAGGVAYVDGFTNSAPNVAWVFTKNLSNGYAKYTAEGIAHESGHTFGLQHQSQYSGTTKTAEYFPGTSAAAPIMGNSYSATRGLWWNGQTVTSTTIQDDVAVLSRSANGFGYRTDDYSSSVASPFALTATNNGITLSASGVIEQTSDADYFSFTAGAGAATFTVSPVLGGMLDAKVQLFDSNNNVIATADAGLSETITTTLTGGTYKLGVFSHGSYGDVGQYTLAGTVVAPVVQVTVNAPTGLTASAANYSTVNLSWADNSNNETGFTIERSTNGGSTWSTAGTVGANVTTFTDTGRTGSTTYTYRIKATNGVIDSLWSTTAQATTPAQIVAPTAPTNLLASPASATQVNLAWTDTANNETGYKVLRMTGTSGTWQTIATLAANTTNYSDAGLTGSTTYTYRVVANNTAGDSAYAEKAVNTPAPVTVPTAPTSLVGTSASTNSITLNWTDGSTNESGFLIERSSNGGSTWTQIGSVAANVNTYTDSTVVAGNTYAYRVRAYNSAGNSNYSPQASLTAQTYSVVVDNNAATGVTGTGTWYRSSGMTGYYGSDYFHDGNTAKGRSSVTFTPTLSTAGTYQVYVRYSGGGNRASNVPMDVAYNGGFQTVYVDQRINGGQWVLLGTFNFNAGNTGSVQVRNGGTNGFVVADAVQFVQTAAASTTAPTVSPFVKVKVTTIGAAAPKASAAKASKAAHTSGSLQLFSTTEILEAGTRKQQRFADDVLKSARKAKAFSTATAVA